MFAMLGDIPFEVIGSPERLRSARRYTYAEQRVIEDRPRLQWIADELEELELELLLHRSFTDPGATLLLLRETAEMHQALPLVFGSGEFRGYFVIASLTTVSRQLSSAGYPVAVTARMVLREWAFEFDPNAPVLSAFAPLAVATALAGVSALLNVSAAAGPVPASLKPSDVPARSIVRSA